MSSEFDSAELDSLFAKLSADTIAPEEHARLDAILRESPEARQRWFKFCDLEAGLKDWAAAEFECRQNRLPTSPATASNENRSPGLAVSVFAVTLLIAIGLIYWANQGSEQPIAEESSRSETRVGEVAVLTCAVNAEWEDDSDYSAGSPLAPSTLHLRSGALLIEFFSGTSVVLEGPAEFELVSRNEGRLQSGRMNAHVPPQANGFTVMTPSGEVLDRGTDFGLVLTDDGPQELHVFNGEVEVKSDTQSLDVQTGQAIRLGAENADVFDADRSAFLLEQELVEQSRLAAKRQLTSWLKASEALSADPATLLHLQFSQPLASADNARRTVVNAARPSDSDAAANVVGSQWVAGRWPGKRGVFFRSPSDRIRLTVPDSMKVMTLLAWVNVQALPRWQNVLLSSDATAPGSVHWHVTKRGQLRLEIARDLGRAESDWEAVESEPFLSDGRQRKWVLLATTFDGTTIRHYANGRLIGQGASFTPESLKIGTAEIGNWSGQTRRDLHAIVDEFAVLARVMSMEEIAEIHSYGKP